MVFLHCASRHEPQGTPSPEVIITYVTLMVFLLHMNSFCLALEVICTCETSAHTSQMWFESPACVKMCLLRFVRKYLSH